MPWLVAQRIATEPKGGCTKVKLKVTLSALVTAPAGEPLTNRSDASTPATGSVKVTTTDVNPVSVEPPSGTCVAIFGLLGLIRK